MEQLTLETNVLAAIIKGKIGVELTFNVDVTAFAHKSTRFIYQTIVDFLGQYGSVPNTDGFEEKIGSSPFREEEKAKLKALAEKIFNLEDGPSRPMFYWEEFRKSVVRRKTKIATEKMLQTINNDPLGARQTLVDDLMKIEGTGIRVKRTSYTESFEERYKEVQRQRQAGADKTLLPLGVLGGKIDNELGGGMRPGEFLLWFAHPGGGKSIAM